MLNRWKNHLCTIALVVLACVPLPTLAAVPALDVSTSGTEPAVLSPFIQTYVDAAGLNVQQVMDEAVQSRFTAPQSKGTALGFGFQSAAIWLRVSLANPSIYPAERILEISYASLVKVDIYQIVDDRIVSADMMGTDRPMSGRLLSNRFFTSPVQIAPGGKTTILIRVESHHPVIVPAKLWTPDAYQIHEKEDYSVQAWYFGIACSMFTFNLLLLVALRDRIYLLYLVWIASLVMTITIGTGIAKQFLWPESVVWASYSNAFADNWSAAALIVFMREMLKTRTQLPRLDGFFKALAWIFLLLPLGFLVNFRAFAEPVLILTTLSGIMVLLVAARVAYGGNRAAIIFLVAFSTLIVASIVSSLWGLDLLPTNFLTVYGFQIGSAIEMILLALALADRFNESRREVLKAQTLALQAEKGRVDALQQTEKVLERRVAERTAALTDSLERLKITQGELVHAEKMASLGSLVAGVAHELNTPIGNALTVATTLTEHAKALQTELQQNGLRKSTLTQFTDNVVPMSELIEGACRKADTLISSFKRVAVDQTSEQRRQFSLLDVVQDIGASLAPSLRKYALTVQIDVPPGIECDGYPGPLGQVLSNLIQNASIHAFDPEQAGTVRIRAWEQDGNVLLHVEDNGKGMEADVLGRIFDPFFTTRLGQGGSGLGLAISMNIVRGVLCGTMQAHSTPAQGSVFELCFPKATPVVEDPDWESSHLGDFHQSVMQSLGGPLSH